MSMQTRPLVFLHLPKTGGVTLRSIIAPFYADDETFAVPDRDAHNTELIPRLVETHAYIHGHINYRCLEPVRDKFDLLTFVREPVSRVISTYHFLREQNPEHATDEETKQLINYARAASLVEFISIEDPAVVQTVCDLQTRTLSGAAYPDPPSLGKAVAVLDGTIFVGAQERFAESVRLMCSTMGWPPTVEPPLLNPSSARRAKPDAELRGRILEMNRLDARLYEHACRLLDARLKASDCGPRAWRRQVRRAEKYRGAATIAGQLFDVAQPLLGTGWFGVEGVSTQRPWRFAGNAGVSTLYCTIQPHDGFDLWSVFHLPFFAPGLRPQDIRILVNGKECERTVVGVSQGHAILLRSSSAILEQDGLQAFSFDSSSAHIDEETLRNKWNDDRDIRFALTTTLHLQISPTSHATVSAHLDAIFRGLADADRSARTTAAASRILLDVSRATPASREALPFDGSSAWSYRRHRLDRLESALKGTAIQGSVESLDRLAAIDRPFLAEILRTLFPHVE